jgi:nucleoside-diphosphate-sugar epimerase
VKRIARGRGSGGGLVVGVTGATSGVGLAVAERLAAHREVGDVRRIDVDRSRLSKALRGVDTLVHLATSYDVRLPTAERRARNVDGTAVVIEAARTAGVRSLVLVTSAEVYGALPDNPVPLAEDAPVRAAAGDDLVGDLVEVERLAAEADGLAVAVLRPAALVGAAEGVYEGSLLRQLAAPRLLAARGTEPLWQLCHVQDLVRAIETTVVAGLSGPLPVACDGWLGQSAVERIARKRRVEMPVTVALDTAARLHRLGAAGGSPRDLEHLLGPVVVASDHLRAAGWAPSWTNEEALRAQLAAGGREGRAGAYTAAGATVALIGTAALVRRTRRRRRGL